MMRIARLYRSRLVHHVTTCIYSLWERGFWLYELFLREFQVISGVAETLLFSFSSLRFYLFLPVLLLSIPLFLFLCQYHWPTESLFEWYCAQPVSALLRGGFRFLHLLLPTSLWASLTSCFPSRERYGLTTFRSHA